MSKKKNKLDEATDLWKENKLVHALQRLDECENEEKNIEDLAEIYLYKGWVLKDMDDLQRAGQFFEKARETTTDSFVMAYSLHGLGSCWLGQKYFQKAAGFFEKAHDIYETILKYKQYDEYFWACASLWLHTLLLSGELEKTFGLEKKLSNKYLMPIWVRASLCKDLGHFYYRENNYEKSIPFYEEALKQVKNIEHVDVPKGEMEGEILAYLGSAYYKIGNEKKGKQLVREAYPHLKDADLKEMFKGYI